ncbi:serine/threonine protein kinase [Rubripirellula reticaptiva]|uniref:Serine/threonine-protein kinase PrkC n=1 Tax=Rubripirellula reticaptiva TaxID=2528013 RepID=A0A5C6FAA2_9BACT|nr:serine/threonine-protein kinase [Rubripirellula reticaptiva]TWU57732.1 Serine/threonine-protein kinase PrkC [Rubripirellula reticaptiva]
MPNDDLTEDSPVTPQSDGEDDKVVIAVKRYMRMLDHGNAPSLDEYLSKHADIAGELRPSLEGLAMIHAMGPPKPAAMVVPDAEFTAKPIGDFQIVGELGRGGMGVVYEAIQLSLGRRVALKVLPFASGLDEVRLQRFRNEAHAAAALHHTNIVPVYAVGSDRGVHYYAMQLIDGKTLADLIGNVRDSNSPNHNPSEKTSVKTNVADASETVTGRQIESTALNTNADRRRYFHSMVRMAVQAAHALDHAHGYGVIHRDIKPANLLLDSVGKLWVTDFGLAQVQDTTSSLTRTGDPMGTLRYMSPEQASGNRAVLDHRTDIYSLGVTLYEMLTLQPAIRGDGYREMLNEIADQEPLSPRSIEASLPLELDTIVRKAIAKLPAERYATAGDFADDLQSWLDDKPIKAKPPTTLERVAKWRRRNNGVVAVASGLLLISTLSLSATTLIIWREQQATRGALDRETEQRRLAEQSFLQARSAVDTFSSLSESELAYRPDLQDLRRSFLETSLEFYRDFMDVRSDDQALASELEATSDRVSKMVNELTILDNVSLLMHLGDRAVQTELAMDPAKAEVIENAIDEFYSQRQSMVNQYLGGLSTGNDEMTDLLTEFDVSVSGYLSKDQLTRLRQIARQRRLPFTFKTSEVVAALELSRQQRIDINRIINQTRPNRGNGPLGIDDPSRGRDGGRRGPPDHDPSRRFGMGQGGPPLGGFGGGDGPPPDEFGDGDGPPRRFDREERRPPYDMWRSAVTLNTVNHIMDILTPEQKQKWDELIGKPFTG